MRSPNWREEELKLALLLYLSKGLKWLAKMNDLTAEIVELSELLNNLDYFTVNISENFRSPSAIRIKLTNFKALDSRYGKSALGNNSNLDKEIWNQYFNKIDNLKNDCLQIIEEHYVRDDKKQIMHIFEMDDTDVVTNLDFLTEWNYFINNTNEQAKRLRRYAADLEDIEMSQRIMNSCYEIIKVLDGYEVTEIKENCNESGYEEHGGINIVPISNNTLKIGKYVQKTIDAMIEKNTLSDNDISNFLDPVWSKNNFHLGHPFFLQINMKKDIKEQITDANGYVRYWTKIYTFHGNDYCICKEWYESGRKFFNAWITKIETNRKIDISESEFRDLLQFLKSADEGDICIKKEEIFSHLKDEAKKEDILDKLISIGLLIEFQGSKREFVIEDYDLLFQMINEPQKYIQGE